MPRELLGQADRELYRMKSRRVPRLLPADAAEPA
jgi:hypothetical protein